jgi:hypothetical protein
MVSVLWYWHYPDFRYFGTGIPGVFKSDFVAEGGATNKNERVNMREKRRPCSRAPGAGAAGGVLEPAAASIACTRAVAAYHFPTRGISRRLNPQLPLQIASSSACEQAVSRELLLPLTRDTVLAAVPWLRSSPKARH